MDWEDYWEKFVNEKKLINKINDMNEIDHEIYGKYKIEDICHSIYNEYPTFYKDLDLIRHDLQDVVEKFPGVHLQTSRVKEIDSLLKKIIDKRSQFILDSQNKYTSIDGKNYKDVLTDLIGIRLIIGYRGNWLKLHNEIIKTFPYFQDKEAYKDGFIPHPKDGSYVIAELPKAYYAYGDDISMYENAGIDTYLRKDGYRSVHYVVSFEGIYVEIQTRTIYDEAWNEIDHSYVYKKELNKSHAALKEMSVILSRFSNLANDLGELMRIIYEDELIYEYDGKFKTKSGIDLQLNEVFDKMGSIQSLMESFRKKIV